MGRYLSDFRLPILAFCATLFYAVPFLDEATSSSSEMTFWSVGQGDFISLVSPETCLFFDIGGSKKLSNIQMKTLKDSCSGKINQLYISHFDQDHIRNYRDLLKAVVIQRTFFSHLEPKSAFGKKFLQELEKEKIPVTKIDNHYRFENLHDGIKLRCLWPTQDISKFRGENDWSLVLSVRVHSKTFLMTGDLPAKMEKRFSVPNSEILKVGHHGSRTSSSADFLRRLRPRICVVSVGTRNSYHHPNHETLERLRDAKCTILRTDRLGSINFAL